VKNHSTVLQKKTCFAWRAAEHQWTIFASGFRSERETVLRSSDLHEPSCLPLLPACYCSPVGFSHRFLWLMADGERQGLVYFYNNAISLMFTRRCEWCQS